MSIVSIVSMALAPIAVGYIAEVKEKICEMNYVKVERMYNVHLEIESREHSDIEFNKYLLQYENVTCMSEGYMSYSEGEVMCEMHKSSEEVLIL